MERSRGERKVEGIEGKSKKKRDACWGKGREESMLVEGKDIYKRMHDGVVVS